MKSFSILFMAACFLICLCVSSSCTKYDLNPHYLDNKEVRLDSTYFSLDSSVAVIYYTLDMGALAHGYHKAILRKDDYDKELTQFGLPSALLVQKWRNNKTLEVIYDEYQGYVQGGYLTDLQMEKDTLERNGVTILVVERRMNKKERLERDWEKYHSKNE